MFVKLLYSKHCKKLIDTLYWIEVYCGNLNMESISKESVSLYWEWSENEWAAHKSSPPEVFLGKRYSENMQQIYLQESTHAEVRFQ